MFIPGKGSPRPEGSWSSGYDIALTQRRSPVRIRPSPSLALGLARVSTPGAQESPRTYCISRDVTTELSDSSPGKEARRVEANRLETCTRRERSPHFRGRTGPVRTLGIRRGTRRTGARAGTRVAGPHDDSEVHE